MEYPVKKKLYVILLLFILTWVYSLEYPGTATGDDFLSIRKNPAAMAFGNAGGIAFIQPFLLDSQYGEKPRVFSDFTFQLAGTNLGYYFDKEDTTFTHNLLTAAEILPNTYTGLRISWTDGELGGAEAGLSLLNRPSDYFSFGGTAESILTPEINGRLGLGLRPFASMSGRPDMLTLGIDFPWAGSFSNPATSVSSELLPGLKIDVSYNWEDELLSAGISYSMGIARFGTIADEETRGAAYTHIGNKNYTTPVLPLTDTYVLFNPGPSIVEESAPGFTFFNPKSPSLLEVLQEIEELRNNPAVKGLVLESPEFQLSWAGYSELITGLNRFREEGKKIVYYFENITLMNYVLASATGDAVYLNRMGVVHLTGIGSTKLYFRDLLETFGIRFHNIRSHPYKTGMNTFSEADMSDAEREMLELFYQGIYQDLLTLIKEGRGDRLKGEIVKIAQKGPYLISEDALEAGLVDGIIYADELTDKLKEFHSNPVITGGNFLPPFRRDWSDPYTQQVALIYAVGLIVPGKGLPGSTIGAETLSDSIQSARENPFVRALVIRIDSGGGSSLASDIIAREVKRTTEAGKPVIISIAGAGASGGYYIAAYADKILASPMSITGSIGVYAAFPEFSGLLDKYGVHTETVQTAENSGFYNPLLPFGGEKEEQVRKSVAYIYRLFLEVVADGRSMDKSAVDEIAQGRIWTGRQAMERGLVDRLGGLFDAVDTAVESAEIRGQYMLVDYSYRNIPFAQRMAQTLSAPLQNVLGLSELSRSAMLLSLLQSEGILLLEPGLPGD